MHMRGASGCRQTVMHDPGAQHPDQLFLTKSRFCRGRKTGYPEKTPQVTLRSTETQSTYDRKSGRCKCRIQGQPDFPRQRHTRMAAHPILTLLNRTYFGDQWKPDFSLDKPYNRNLPFMFFRLQKTFKYHSKHWTNDLGYNEKAGTNMKEEETKLSSYWSTPFTRLCLGMRDAAEQDTNWISLEHAATSLRDVIGNGNYTATNLTITKWKSLLTHSQIDVSYPKVNLSVIKKFLFRPCQYCMKPNAQCVDKHLQQTYI